MGRGWVGVGWRKEARKGSGMNHQGQDRTRQRIQALVSAAPLHLLSRPLLGSLLVASAAPLAGRYNSHALAYRSSLKNRKRPLCRENTELSKLPPFQLSLEWVGIHV